MGKAAGSEQAQSPCRRARPIAPCGLTPPWRTDPAQPQQWGGIRAEVQVFQPRLWTSTIVSKVYKGSVTERLKQIRVDRRERTLPFLPCVHCPLRHVTNVTLDATRTCGCQLPCPTQSRAK